MTDLRKAILARLDALDATARNAMRYTSGNWTVVPGGSMVDLDCTDIEVDGGVIQPGTWDSIVQTASDPFVAEHIVAFRPPVVLGITAAIRAVLELHQPENNEYVDADGQSRASTDCTVCDTGGVPNGWPCPTVRAIAKRLGVEVSA